MLKMDELIFLPIPKKIDRTAGSGPHRNTFELLPQQLIVIDDPQPVGLWSTAKRLQKRLKAYADLDWEIVAGATIPEHLAGIVLTIEDAQNINPQGYELVISQNKVTLTAGDASGAFYAAATLIQIIQQYGAELPVLTISDWPDYANRGVMLDISRDKVPTMETLYQLVDLLASWKINQLQMNTEHTFAYRNHPEVWSDASPITGEEILALDAFCKDRFIDLVPNQNSFGHMNRWLRHEKYRHLAESPDGYKLYDLFSVGPETLNPVDPESLKFIESLYDELLPHFSSTLFNAGLDETLELGEGRSKKVVDQKGKLPVYLDFLLSIEQAAKSHGKRMMFWNDMLRKEPELLKNVPKDCIALIWGYEAAHPFEKQCQLMADTGIPYYVCPGTSSWRSISGRTENALQNIANAAEAGLKHGALGLLNTDWGDRGHWQPLPVSYAGFSYGAAVSWGCKDNRDIDLGSVLDLFAFMDSEKIMGNLCINFGKIHLETGCGAVNSTILFNILHSSVEKATEMIESGDTGVSIGDVITLMFDSDQSAQSDALGKAITPQMIIQATRGEFYKLTESNLNKTNQKIDSLMTLLNQANGASPDFEMVRNEYRYIADLLRHACKRGFWLLGKAKQEDNLELRKILINEIDELISRHQEVWMLRNRSGGLKDSLSALERLQNEYMNA